MAWSEYRVSVFNKYDLFFNPQLTGGIPSVGRVMGGLMRLLYGSRRAPYAITKWFGGAVSAKCYKHERGMEILDGFLLGS